MKTIALPLGILLLLALAGCSAGVSGGSSPAPMRGSSTAAPSGSASTAPPEAATGRIDVCSEIPVTAVAQETGRSVYATAHEIDGASEGAQVYACEYTDSADAADALDGFNLVVYRGGDTGTIMSELAKSQTSGAKPISGIGDRAQLGDGELDVVVGGDVVVASDSVHEGGLADLDPTQLRALAHKVMALL